MPTKRTAATLAVLTAVTAGTYALSLLPGAAPSARATGLTPYDSCAQLLSAYRLRLVKNATAYDVRLYAGEVMSGAPTTAAADGSRAVGTSGTGTNVQEVGVDEPDTAKVAGNVLVVAAGSTVQLVRPGATPELLGTVRLGQQAHGAQLLIDGTRVLALTQGYDSYAPAGGAADMKMMMMPGYDRTVATLIDIADPRAPKVLESSTTDGRLVSARLAGGRVRLIVSSAARPETPAQPSDGSAVSQQRALVANQATAARTPLDRVLPQRERRSASGTVLEKGPAVGCADVSYPAGGGGTTTLTLTSLDLRRSLAPTGTVAVNADGDLVYASTAKVYVATSRWGTTTKTSDAPDSGEVSTELHEFALTQDSATYRASGSVPGYLLNSYSLSEHADHLRVVTTRQPSWRDQPGAGIAPPQRQETSASLLVLRDNGRGDLVTTGRVDGLGRGEQVYAVRFLGDIATVVTFRQTDPLYTLDLADPAAPKVLGQLKIPGFSNYLHPIGGDTLVGIGQDADLQGRVIGLQLATFDLSDLASPKRTRVLGLGQGYSEAANDPHAFVFSPELGLLTIPVSDPSGASTLLGVRVSAGELSEVGRLADPYGSGLRRTFVVDGRLLAVSDIGVVAARVQDLHQTGAVRFRL